MQGCPYDALYIDPSTETAAKCNFCAHKVEVGLEPPCVTVCPTQAIVAGDLRRPREPHRPVVGRVPVQVRKPEKGTRPKVFYIDGDAGALVPSAAPPARTTCGRARRRPTALPAMRGRRGGRRAPPDVRGQGAAPQLVGLEGVGVPLDEVAGRRRLSRARARRPARPLAAAAGAPRGRRPLAFLAVTGAPPHLGPAPAEALPVDADPSPVALVADARVVHHRRLRRPARHPPPASVPGGPCRALAHRRSPLLLAAGTAVYTAFLFGQSKGRDLWQSALLAPHLIVQALTGGRGRLRARPGCSCCCP